MESRDISKTNRVGIPGTATARIHGFPSNDIDDTGWDVSIELRGSSIGGAVISLSLSHAYLLHEVLSTFFDGYEKLA